ncbi:hypothetical protein Scep_001167 [Stephania cephalantha]|uniref:Uncharacterized protein n=1 Tax=Stephania cephalantha TaxID=152367 RepID=A0AAP0L7W5_9MAGN
MILDTFQMNTSSKLSSGSHILGNVLVHETAVLGEGCLIEDVHVCDEIYYNGGVVLPHKEINSSILKPDIGM